MASERTMRFERRMSDAEALMWDVEKDPALRSSFLNITLLDQAPDFAAFRRRMGRAVAEIPRLRQRVAPAFAGMAPPEWRTDTAFDLDFHVRRVAVAPPGTDRQMLDLAALVYEDAFDRARPLWQFTVVEGLEGGRAALLGKMHHTITDGVGGVRLSALFVDLEREGFRQQDLAGANESGPDGEQAQLDTAGREAFVEQLLNALGHSMRRQLGMTWRAVRESLDLATHPAKVPVRAIDTAALVRALVQQVLVVEPARSPLWTGRRSLRRRFEIMRLDLDDLKRVGKSLGGTVNDAFVTGLAGGVGTYHRLRGAEVDELRMSMPVSTRDDRSAGGNAFSPTRLLVPVGIKDPVERFTVVRERIGYVKRDRTLRLTDSFAAVLRGLPTSLLVRLVQAQVGTVDFAASNVRGAPFDLFIGGAHILANHPMGPTGGTAMNATVLSYKTSLDMGINVDPAAVDDPELLRDSIEESFAELLASR